MSEKKEEQKEEQKENNENKKENKEEIKKIDNTSLDNKEKIEEDKNKIVNKEDENSKNEKEKSETEEEKENDSKQNQNKKGKNFKPEDYILMLSIGTGNFSNVHLVEHKDTKILYALKSFEKRRVESLHKERDVLMEKHALEKITPNEYIIGYYGSAKDDFEMYKL